MELVQDDQHIRIEPIATFLVIFGVHMKILLVFKAKIVILTQMLIEVPPIMLTNVLRMVIIF